MLLVEEEEEEDLDAYGEVVMDTCNCAEYDGRYDDIFLS